MSINVLAAHHDGVTSTQLFRLVGKRDVRPPFQGFADVVSTVTYDHDGLSDPSCL
jgi:hypothetical protein